MFHHDPVKMLRIFLQITPNEFQYEEETKMLISENLTQKEADIEWKKIHLLLKQINSEKAADIKAIDVTAGEI